MAIDRVSRQGSQGWTSGSESFGRHHRLHSGRGNWGGTTSRAEIERTKDTARVSGGRADPFNVSRQALIQATRPALSHLKYIAAPGRSVQQGK